MILGTALGMFEGKEVDSIDLKNEKNVVSFKLDEETGELYRIEIDEKGNKKKYIMN